MQNQVRSETHKLTIETPERGQEDDFILRLQRHYSDLRKSEKKIADYLQQHSSERLDLSITEFAKLLQVSETTVSRFCRAIGYRGFQDLKLSLATSINTTEQFRNIPADIHDTDSTPDVAKKLADALANAMIETQRMLSMEQVDASVEAIVKAEQVFLYGIGGSSVAVTAAHHLLTKAGISCSAYADGYTQIVTASMAEPGRVVIGISISGRSKHVVDAIKIAAEHGAFTIGITCDAASPLADESHIKLITPGCSQNVPLYGDFMEARASQLYIMDLLYLRILFKQGTISKKYLQETTEVLNTYYNPINYPNL